MFWWETISSSLCIPEAIYLHISSSNHMFLSTLNSHSSSLFLCYRFFPFHPFYFFPQSFLCSSFYLTYAQGNLGKASCGNVDITVGLVLLGETDYYIFQDSPLMAARTAVRPSSSCSTIWASTFLGTATEFCFIHSRLPINTLKDRRTNESNGESISEQKQE